MKTFDDITPISERIPNDGIEAELIFPPECKVRKEGQAFLIELPNRGAVTFPAISCKVEPTTDLGTRVVCARWYAVEQQLTGYIFHEYDRREPVPRQS